MRRKRNKNIQLPRDKEESYMKEIRDQADDLISMIGELEIDQDDKDYICNSVEELSTLTIALLNRTTIPKGGLHYPWDKNEAS